MTSAIYQVVKEFTASVDGIDFEVKGRILKRIHGDDLITADFKWEISHYYQPLDGFAVYHPSQDYAETLERAEDLLLIYMKNFATIKKVEINPKY